jgi:alpha-tubulin suppressor-like RCC1 family protein
VLANVRDVSNGFYHTCSINVSDYIWCWGTNDFGQIGNGTQDKIKEPIPINEGTAYKMISSGRGHTCAIRKADNTLWCWGDNNLSQLGKVTAETTVLSPMLINNDLDWNMVSAGESHTCAVKTDNSLWCFGYNQYGQLGNGQNDTKKTPVQVGLDKDWKYVSAGGAHTCAIKKDDSFWCFGSNIDGQLGNGKDGEINNSNIPVQVKME